MMERSEVDLFSETVTKVFDQVRGDTGGDGAAAADSSARADAGLSEIGWRDALDAWGGTAVDVVLGTQGRACATSGALDDVLAHALGLGDAPAVLLPRLGAHTPPAALAGDVVTIAGTATARVRRTEEVAVVVDTPDGARLYRVPLALLAVEPVTGLDPAAGLSVVTGDVPVGDLADGSDVVWDRVRTWGQIALASELVGTGRAMLDLALEHATSRVQFGRTIGSFQAVRHRLVDAFLALEGAGAAVEACCAVTDPPPAHAAMAKSLAGTAARTAAKHGQQVLAGIGFTAEHAFHHYLRRSMVLDRLFGSSSALTREVGELTLAERRVPMDLPL